MPHILLLGTLDTKRAEVQYVHKQLLQTASLFSAPIEITVLDCGCQNNRDLSKYAPDDAPDLQGLARAQAIELIIAIVTKYVAKLLRTTEVHGIIGAGGSGGTSLISSVMRAAAPIGLPKLIVSTVASGDTSPIVGECDITLMYSIVDIAGNNRLLHEVLGNATGAIFGMASAYQQRLHDSQNQSEEKKTRVGITMFGVTTPCVDQVRRHLEENYPVEVYIFHATGHGGSAMERLVEEGRLDAVLDITTTEICDYVAGGVMSCGPHRLEATLRRGIPNIISVGATDMVNFGPIDTVPAKHRHLYKHNRNVTLMRTSIAECQKVGEFIRDKLDRYTRDPSMVEVWLPRGGVSSISTPGSVFEDVEADNALAEVLLSSQKDSGVRVVSHERDVNDRGFAKDIANRLMELVVKHSGG